MSFTESVSIWWREKADVAIRSETCRTAPGCPQARAEPASGLRRALLPETQWQPATPGDLEYHDCLTFNFRRRASVWPFRARTAETSSSRSPEAWSVNNGETMRQVALAGLGIARLGLFHVASRIKTGCARAVAGENSIRAIWK